MPVKPCISVRHWALATSTMPWANVVAILPMQKPVSIRLVAPPPEIRERAVQIALINEGQLPAVTA